MNNQEQQIVNLIDQSESILLMPSSPPDGDSLGSAMALFLALRKMGKKATVVCADPVPDVLKFLPMINTIKDKLALTPDFIVTLDVKDAELDSIQSRVEHDKVNVIFTAKKGKFSENNVSFSHGPSKYDLIITVDTAAPEQLGRFYRDNVQLFTEVPVVNIDHHASNEKFGRINYVDVMSSSTTEIIQQMLEALEEERGIEIIDEDIATLLLAGIITDTGSFQHSNTNPKSFSNSARLIRRGADQQNIIQHVYKTKQLSTLRLWGRSLTNIKVDQKHRMLWSFITQRDLIDTASEADETGNIIDELMTNAPQVDIVLLLKEKQGRILSGSLRTKSDGVDASEIAAMFGGGGHSKAAGFKIMDADFESHGQTVVSKIQDYQATRLQLTEDEVPAEQPKEEIKVPQLEEKVQIEEKPPKPKKAKKISKKDDSTYQIDPGILYKFED